MDWVAIILTGIFGVSGGSVTTALVQGYYSRRREDATAVQMTAAAHHQIYESYGELIEEIQGYAAMARDEARGAKAEAREANLRATAAEARAASAEHRATAAEVTLAEMKRLIVANVPQAAQILANFGEIMSNNGFKTDLAAEPAPVSV